MVSGDMSVHMCVFCMPKALPSKGIRVLFCVDVCEVFHCFM